MQQDDLIAQLQAKNEKAFERIYQVYSDSLFGTIYSITRDKAISEEILQDVFLKIWDTASTYDRKKGRFFTWLLNIARDSAIDRKRSRNVKDNKPNLISDVFTDNPEVQNTSAGKADATGLTKHIIRLETVCKKVISLLFFQGYTLKETAEELDIPLEAVKTRNRACIDKLRKRVIS